MKLTQLKSLTAIAESKNHIGESEYQTYAGWKRACKKQDSTVWFDGDEDIAQAMVGPKPFKRGETKSIGEWDGDVGSVYLKEEAHNKNVGWYVENISTGLHVMGPVSEKEAKAEVKKRGDDYEATYLSDYAARRAMSESAEYAKKLVRGEKSAPGVMNKIDAWFTRAMFTKDKNRFLPAHSALKQLKLAGFNDHQIHQIRDAAAIACNTAVERMQSKYGDRVPDMYVSKDSDRFGVFDLFLNVADELRDEYAALMRKLFDAKLDKIKDELVIVKENASLEEALKTETTKMPNGQRPKGYGWELKQAGEQSGKDFSVWQRKVQVLEDTNLQSLGKSLKSKPAEIEAPEDAEEKTDVNTPPAAEEPTETEEAPAAQFKVGDKVKPTKGPHKGEIHSIVKVVDVNGGFTYDIKPDGIEGEAVKYAKGGANAKAEQLELAEGLKLKAGQSLLMALEGYTALSAEAREREYSTAHADGKMHPIEDQWHYKKMTDAGFTSDTKPQKGLVRSYMYTHKDGRKIKLTTGISSDRWEDQNNGAIGYHAGLQAYLKKSAVSEATADRDGMMPLSYRTNGPRSGKHKIEAYGRKGMKNVMWRKTFKDEDALEKWCDANDAECEGTREIKDGE